MQKTCMRCVEQHTVTILGGVQVVAKQPAHLFIPHHANGDSMSCSNHTQNHSTDSSPSSVFSLNRYGHVELTVIRDRSLTQTDRLVYASLKAHRNHKTGTAWPSRQIIAEIVGCTENQITKSTRRLAKSGYLLKEQRPGRSTQYRFPLAYQSMDTPIQRDRGSSQTPIQADCHNRQGFIEQTKEPQQPTHLPDKSSDIVVVVPESVASTPIILEIQPPPLLDTLKDDDQVDQIAIDPEAAEIPVIQDKIALETSDNPDPCVPIDSKISDGTHQEASVPADTDDPLQSLTFPGFVSLVVQAQIIKSLCGVPLQDAQALLDELAGAGQKTLILNPIGYLRRLLSLHREGTLILEHAHRISEGRRRQRENEAALKRATERRLDSGGGIAGSSGPPDPKRNRQVALDAIAQIRVNLGSSVRQPPS